MYIRVYGGAGRQAAVYQGTRSSKVAKKKDYNLLRVINRKDNIRKKIDLRSFFFWTNRFSQLVNSLINFYDRVDFEVLPWA